MKILSLVVYGNSINSFDAKIPAAEFLHMQQTYLKQSHRRDIRTRYKDEI